MQARRFALIIGIIYILVGVLGFVPMLSQTAFENAPRLAVPQGYGYLLGLFPINLLHNLFHLGIGALGIACSRTFSGARIFTRGLAIIYGMLAIMGLIPGLNTLFGVMPIFGNDIWLHALTALVAAYFGLVAQDPTPRKRQFISIAPNELERLAESLRQYGLSTADVNTNKTVTFALPGLAITDGQEPVLLQIVPLQKVPTQTEQELYSSEKGIPIGVLAASKVLLLSAGQGDLPAGAYLTVVRRGQVLFINAKGTEFPGSSLADNNLRRLKRIAPRPYTFITTKEICYTWNSIQICTEPSILMTLTVEQRTAISSEMRRAVDSLVAAGKLQPEDINVEGTLPDVEGSLAVQARQASILAAPPTVRAATANHGLLGVFDVLLEIDVPGTPPIPRGAYVVQIIQPGADEAIAADSAPQRGKLVRSQPDYGMGVARLISAANPPIDIPVRLGEVRGEIKGQPKEPEILVLNLCGGLIGLPDACCLGQDPDAGL